MSDISFDDSTKLGYLLEGVLRKGEDGWILEDVNGNKHKIDDKLDDYKNKEIRFTVVDLQEAEQLQLRLQQQRANDHVEGTDK